VRDNRLSPKEDYTMFNDWTDEQFAEYLLELAADLIEGGFDATAEDYIEAAHRILRTIA
jgi:hypothetical protein